jgi:DNA-directed RNA polymerase specialized sigma24 family protein
MDVSEVASALRISEGTAKTTLFRARQRLAKALAVADVEEATDVVDR